MQSIQIRYDNFKHWLGSIIPNNNEYLVKLCNTDLQHFLLVIKSMGLDINHTSKELLKNELFQKTQLSRNSFSDEQINKFVRYVQYFAEIANEI